MQSVLRRTDRTRGRGSLARWRELFALFVLVAVGTVAAAAEVTALLSEDSTVVGDPVRLEIRVEGGRPSGPPREINVEGLNVSYIGSSQSSQFSFGNGGLRSLTTISYNYQVIADRAGNFTIPALDLEVDGRAYQTKPVALRVGGGGAAQPGRGSAQGGGNAPPLDKISFAEIVLPKQTAYVGEALPVEFRLYVDTRVSWQPESMPEFTAEGFTKTKMTEPRQERARRDGREYDVLVFKTAITPTKAGKVKLGPSTINFNAQIPRARPNRRGSAFDPFGDDWFTDPNFRGFGALERRKATAAAVEIDVKPLPAAGKPETFSGAVGKYTMSADGTPREVKVGDPLTMTVIIEGRGNFDRINAPVIKDPAGWRSYPPSSNFRADDDVSYRGSKSFQVAVIPETKKTTMPQFEFAYFDPDTEKYVTLTTQATPLRVTGDAPPPPAPVPKSQESAPVRAATPLKPEIPPPSAADILGNRYDEGRSGSFTPIYEQRMFWLVQILPAAVLLGMLMSRVFTRNDAAARASQLKQQKSMQLARLRHERARVPFLDAATRAIQIDTAIVTGQEPSTVDASLACRSRQLDPETVAAIESIFSSRAEALYAGAEADGGTIPSTERDRILAAVSEFERSHGRN